MKREYSTLVIDRLTQQRIKEETWGEWWLQLLYGDSFLSCSLGRFLLHTLFRWPILSWLIGHYYDTAYSRRYIEPFCRRFHINTSEQALPLNQFKSFNDFFTRALKPACRTQYPDSRVVTIPADGRYRVIPVLDSSTSISVKQDQLNLERLLNSPSLASHFIGGVGVVCRLCPADCHRFFFPFPGRPDQTVWIHGSLFSVNPQATDRYPWILWTNRRALTLINSERIGTMAYIEVGATNCGSIIQDFVPDSWVNKGQEKGHFRIGGSAIILLFEANRIQIADDLLSFSASGHEVLCQIGQPLATLSVN